jgi:hypothetical protein
LAWVSPAYATLRAPIINKNLGRNEPQFRTA